MSKYIKIADFDEIYDLHIKKKCSKHDEIQFKARLTENQNKEWENLSKKAIRVDFFDEEQESEEQNVFQGNVDKINMEYKSSWFCEVIAYSFSIIMDKEPKKRIFQNPDKNLLEIIEAVCKDYENIILKDQGAEQISVPCPVIQYEETDWNFLVRITRKYGLDIIINQDDENANEGTLWIGKIDRKAREISEDMIVEKSYSEEGIQYKFLATDIFEVGDRVSLNDKEYSIIGCDFYLDNNALTRKYTFGNSRLEKDNNPKLKGLILKAEVISLEGDGKEKGQIQVKFNIEPESCINPIWIDWAVSYCDENIGIYNMPAIGEKVLVHIMDDDAEELIAKSNLRSKKVDSEIKVTDKLLRIGNKEILINDNSIRFKNENTIVLLESSKFTIQTENGKWIFDTEGLSIDTNKNPISIKSGDVKIENGNLSISSKKIDIDSNDINLKGMVKVK